MARRKPNQSLTPLEELFCYEYIKDLKPRMAGIRAGYTVKSNSGCMGIVMKKPAVQAFIKQLMDERKADCMVTAKRILENLAAAAFSDINNVLSIQKKTITREIPSPNGKGEIKTEEVVVDEVVFRPWHTHDTRAIQSIKQSDNGGISVKMVDATKNRELLMRHIGMLKDANLEGVAGFVQAFTEAEAKYKATKAKEEAAKAGPGGKQ
jgi:phage terminase small subunit